MLEEIVDHRINEDAVAPEHAFYKSVQGQKKRKRTTKGHQVCFQWKDGSTDWIDLKDFKDSYPVELAEYAVINGIADQPAYAGWVPYVLKKRERIIQKLKSKYWKRTHKYGIRIPRR